MENICDTSWSKIRYLQTWQVTTIAVLNSILSLTTLILNVCMLVIICKTKQQLRNASGIFLASLSASDCCLACIGQSQITLVFTKFKNYCDIQISTQFWVFFFAHLSGYLIVTIATDRSLRLKYLKRYNIVVTKASAFTVCILCISLAFFVGISYSFAAIYRQYKLINRVVLVLDLLSVTLVFISYLLAYKKIRRNIKQTGYLRNVTSKSMQNFQPHYTTEVMKMIVRIVVVIWIAYVPYIILSIILSHGENYYNADQLSSVTYAVYMTFLLIYMNSTINAIVFLSSNQEFKQFLKRLYTERKSRSIQSFAKNSINSNVPMLTHKETRLSIF